MRDSMRLFPQKSPRGWQRGRAYYGLKQTQWSIGELAR